MMSRVNPISHCSRLQKRGCICPETISQAFHALVPNLAWFYRRVYPRRDTLLMFLYNTGARVQEAADLRNVDIDLDEPYRVRLHGKGDKWRCCPLWPETVGITEATDNCQSG